MTRRRRRHLAVVLLGTCACLPQISAGAEPAAGSESGTKLAGDALIADKISLETPASVFQSAGGEEAGMDMDLLATERLGELAVGMDAARVAEILGKPKSKDRPIVWAADGLFHGIWRYPNRGVAIGMVSDSADGGQEIASIDCGPSCRLETQRNLGIGARYEEVAEAYKEVEDRDGSEAPSVFVAGSLYGGLVFSFEEGKVHRIFLGAAAE